MVREGVPGEVPHEQKRMGTPRNSKLPSSTKQREDKSRGSSLHPSNVEDELSSMGDGELLKISEPKNEMIRAKTRAELCLIC